MPCPPPTSSLRGRTMSLRPTDYTALPICSGVNLYDRGDRFGVGVVCVCVCVCVCLCLLDQSIPKPSAPFSPPSLFSVQPCPPLWSDLPGSTCASRLSSTLVGQDRPLTMSRRESTCSKRMRRPQDLNRSGDWNRGLEQGFVGRNFRTLETVSLLPRYLSDSVVASCLP